MGGGGGLEEEVIKKSGGRGDADWPKISNIIATVLIRSSITTLKNPKYQEGLIAKTKKEDL